MIFYCKASESKEYMVVTNSTTHSDDRVNDGGNKDSILDGMYAVKPLTINLCVQGINIQFENDTGVSISTISKEKLTRIG